MMKEFCRDALIDSSNFIYFIWKLNIYSPFHKIILMEIYWLWHIRIYVENAYVQFRQWKF